MNTDKFIITELTRSRGEGAAHAYAMQTLHVYRQAILNPRHFASTPTYRRSFIMSYLFFKHYLGTHMVKQDMADTHSGNPDPQELDNTSSRTVEGRERMIDTELDGTFPASDPPSWTMGGSLVSQYRKH
jgi:hypothetical protein